MKKSIVRITVFLLVLSQLLIATPIVKAADSTPVVEWQGWWVGNSKVTVAYLGETVVAKVRLNNQLPGEYRIRVNRDVRPLPDIEIVKLEFSYDGSNQVYELTFTPSVTTGGITNGYHIDVYMKEWGFFSKEIYTHPHFYPPRLRVFSTNPGWTYYHSYSEIEAGLRSLESSGIAKVSSIGVTGEGRDIWAVKISDNPSIDDQNEPDILFTGVHHAREWISGEVAYYLAVNLVNQYQSSSDIKTLVDNSEIWIVPIVNPDGFEYSQAGVWDSTIADPPKQTLGNWSRFWRKNRRDNGDNTIGVDLNRNYAHSEWGKRTWAWLPLPTTTSSSAPSSDVYFGPSASSEPETTAIQNLINGGTKNFEAVLSYHSYSQLILYPWSYTDEDEAPRVGMLKALANEMSNQICRVHGKSYTAQQSSALYKTTGDLTDWVYETKGIPAFTIELRPTAGFLGADWGDIIGLNAKFALPEDEILPTCEENWPAALYLIKWVVGTQGGFMDFENGTDGVPIKSTIPGMSFTTTQGYDWIYGDKRTGNYNVYPYGDQNYECNGNFFAWLGPNQGSGRIDFTGATAKTVSMLTSCDSGIYLDAYDSNGSCVASDYATGNLNTRTMSEISVSAPSISYVIVHDAGNYWLVDDMRVRDLLRETNAFQPFGAQTILQILDLINTNQTSEFNFFNDTLQTLKIILSWPGSKLGVQVCRPDGTIFFEGESDSPPISIPIPLAEVGTWTIRVTGMEIPYENYPFAIDVAGTLSMAPVPPTAEAGPDQTVERTSEAGAEVTLDGSGSYDPDGDPLTYNWTWASGSASGVSPTVVMPMETTVVTLEVSDGALTDTDTVSITVQDTTPPIVTVEFPTANLAVQDGITLKASAWDLSGVDAVYFYIREPDGPAGEVISPEFENLPAVLNSSTGKWEYDFDTLELPDGNYIVLAKGVDTYANEGWSACVPFSIRNWAVITLLPSTPNSKAGRTMPIKFALRVSASVDPAQPFVWNDELTIKIYVTSNPGVILQTSTFGSGSTDYRIGNNTLYITNFKTSKVPMHYTVEIWRTSKNFMVGSFTFKTVK